MHIRAEQPDDIDRIRNVHLQAFDSDAEASLVDRLRRSGVELISLLAEAQGEVVGHILFSPVTIDGHENVMGLAPLAVLPAWQRKGVGARLVNAGLLACTQAGYDAVIVLGHPDYYPRFGFEPAIDFGIRSVYDAPPEAFMVLELRPGGLHGIAGTARYHPAFDEV